MSRVWKYFERSHFDNKAKCLICLQLYTFIPAGPEQNFSAANLFQHLRRAHPVEYSGPSDVKTDKPSESEMAEQSAPDVACSNEPSSSKGLVCTNEPNSIKDLARTNEPSPVKGLACSNEPCSTKDLACVNEPSSAKGPGEIPCAVCYSKVEISRLKYHIFTRHFPFYRPYHCKKCQYKCASMELFIQEHRIVSDHEELEPRGRILPHFELLVEMLYRHSLRLNAGDLETPLKQLTNFRDVYSKIKEKYLSSEEAKDASAEESEKSAANLCDADSFMDDGCSSPNNTVSCSSTDKVDQASIDREKQNGPSDPKRPRLESSASRDLSFNDSSSIGIHLDAGQQDATVDTENSLRSRLPENDSLPPLTTPFPAETSGRLSSQGEIGPMDSLLTTLDSIIDAKVLPVFMNVDGVDQQSSTNFVSPTQSTNVEATAERPSSTETGNGPNLNVSKSDAPSSSFDITCDVCQEICVNKDVLKHHLLAKHVGGYCSSFCSACHFKDPNARRVSDHCRSVHKNMKFLKQCKPTDEQWRLLLDIKTSLQRRHIDFDLPKRD